MEINFSAYKVDFNGRPRKYYTEELKKLELNDLQKARPCELSLTSLKLLAAMDFTIEKCWTDIKKGRTSDKEPLFVLYNAKSDETVMVKPLYGGNRPTMLFEVETPKCCERFVFDRRKPQNFRYEKTIVTDYGCATLKSYDSRVAKNSEIVNRADAKITEYIPQILSRDVKNEYFRAETAMHSRHLKF